MTVSLVLTVPRERVQVPAHRFAEVHAVPPEHLATTLNRLSGDVLLITEPEVQLTEAGLDRFLQTPGAWVYSDYEEEGRRHRLLPDLGDITERFKTGPVQLIRREVLARTGGARPWRFATLYDLRLRWMEQGGTLTHIPEPLYRKVPREDALQQMVKSDSFAYLFYSPEADREYETVFKQWLRRQGAFLDGTYDPLPDDADAYPVTVSVIIPVKDRQDYIGAAIESVVRGTFSDFEVIVVDAGSTDRTPEIVQAWAARDPRVRYLWKPPGNIAQALNFGLRHARGRYIAQLDSDDFYEPDTLAAMVAYMDRHPGVGLAISYYRVTDPEGRPLPLEPIKHLEYDRNNILRVDGAGALRFFRHAVFKILGPYNEVQFGDYAEDYDMVLRISERFRVGRVHRVLYNYRRHEGSTDATRSLVDKAVKKTAIRKTALQRRRLRNQTLQMMRGLQR